MDIFSEKSITKFGRFLADNDRSENTISKYIRDVRQLAGFAGSRAPNRSLLVGYKAYLAARYAPASVNSMLAAVNSFLVFIGRADLRVKPLKIQKRLFSGEEKQLEREEYARLVETARAVGNERLALIAETICSTGIRVSELKFITAESVRTGRAEICCKGKRRTVFLPEKLREVLKGYTDRRGIVNGAVFVTRTGKPLDRSNVWREMKNLCEGAEVAKEKVFPHNLRHLFARTFYSVHKDISRLADILGHSSINTTRVYTMESGAEHARLVDRLDLVINTT